MRITTAAILAVVALALLTPNLAHADTVYLDDGTTHEAKILEVLPDGIRVEFHPKTGGVAKLTVPASRLDPNYFYNLADQALGDDAKGRLKLALWAFDAGLFARSKKQVQKAAKLDPQLVADIQDGKLPEIREKIAAKVLESAEKNIKHDDLELAGKKLEALLSRMPDTEAGTAAVEVYEDLQTKMEAWHAKKAEEEQAQLDEEAKEADEARAKLLVPVDRELKRGKELLTKGLTTDDEAKSLSLLQQALGKGKIALQKLDGLDKNHGDDAELMAEVQERRDKTIAAMVKAYLYRADIYTWRGATNNARKEIEKARELDPENPDLAAAEERTYERENDDALELRWQRNRREGMRFRGGGAFHGGRGGVGPGGGGMGGGRRR